MSWTLEDYRTFVQAELQLRLDCARIAYSKAGPVGANRDALNQLIHQICKLYARTDRPLSEEQADEAVREMDTIYWTCLDRMGTVGPTIVREFSRSGCTVSYSI